MEFENKNKDLIEDFKQFESSSYTKFKDLYEQIKNDRKYIAGDQLDDVDDNLLGDEVKCKLNITQNAIRTIVNTYLPNQYKWSYNDEQLNQAGIDFLSDVDNYTASVEALQNAVGTALGVIVFSTDTDIDGSIKPIIYSVPDVTNVRLDPNATKLNFADSTKAAIVELKSKEWVEQNYGVEVNNVEKPLIDISETYDRKNLIPLVTYYKKENDKVTVYKLLNDDLLEEPIVLPYSYIPVVPVFGEQSWTKDNKQTWSGITTQMRSIQRLVNYSYRQLLIRCAKVPKNTWQGGVLATQNFEKYYQNADKTMNPFLPHNEYGKGPDGNVVKLEAPTRISNEIQFADVSQLMQNALGLTNTIIGIPAAGLETDVSKTATEVLTNEKIFNNNVRNYLYHLKFSMQLLGMIFAENFYNQPLFGKIKVSVVEGPDGAMEKQEARLQLQQYAALVTSDTEKQKLLLAQCAVDSDNEYVKNFAMSLQPAPTQGELEAQQMVEQANNEIKQRDQQIFDLQKQLQELQQQQQVQAYSLQREMLLEQQKFEHNKEMKLLEAKLEKNDPQEIMKADAEITKAQLDVEKAAVELRKEEVGGLV